jgi:hypothetical protein
MFNIKIVYLYIIFRFITENPPAIYLKMTSLVLQRSIDLYPDLIALAINGSTDSLDIIKCVFERLTLSNWIIDFDGGFNPNGQFNPFVRAAIQGGIRHFDNTGRNWSLNSDSDNLRVCADEAYNRWQVVWNAGQGLG